MCMNSEYMFLTMVIPDTSNLKRLITVYLKSLIEELQNLWHVDLLTHDNATNQAFVMHTRLMWTVNDLSVYGMASRWSAAEVMGCPVYIDDTWTFHLPHGRKAGFTAVSPSRPSIPLKKLARPRMTGEQIHNSVAEFSPLVQVPLTLPPSYNSEYKWTKKSIFWELEYWGSASDKAQSSCYAH
ncbi:UNVERIFIED_CONTAM: hypothetical protein Scaly_2513400 [Sesamum calycinum]|uniref:Uncharacterized protein n=1 Tax=Sesamum calycinum TaxID=2727403 RepID=A0AAW2LSP6_9LAMI